MTFRTVLILSLLVQRAETNIVGGWEIQHYLFRYHFSPDQGIGNIGKSPASSNEMSWHFKVNYIDSSTVVKLETPKGVCLWTRDDFVSPEEIFLRWSADMLDVRTVSQWDILQADRSDDIAPLFHQHTGYQWYHSAIPHIRENVIVEGQTQYNISLTVVYDIYQFAQTEETVSYTAWDRWGEFVPTECNPLVIAGTGATESAAPVYLRNQTLQFRASLNSPLCAVGGDEPCAGANWGIYFKDDVKCSLYRRLDTEHSYRSYSTSLNDEDENTNIWKTVTFQPYSLPTGTILLHLTSTDDPVNPSCFYYAKGWFKMVEPQRADLGDPTAGLRLETTVFGDTNVTRLASDNVNINASLSYDPYGILDRDAIWLSWNCSFGDADAECPLLHTTLHPSIAPAMVFLGAPAGTYRFSVMAYSRNRVGESKSVFVNIIQRNSVEVTIKALFNGMDKINPDIDLVLEATSPHWLMYTWSVKVDWYYDVPDDDWLPCCPGGRYSSVLRLLPGCLMPGNVYTIAVEGKTGINHGSRDYTRKVAYPPTVGICDIHPRAGVSLSTDFAVLCQGFNSDDDLTYMLYKNESLLSQSDTGSMRGVQLAAGSLTNNYVIEDLSVQASSVYGITLTVQLPRVQVVPPSLDIVDLGAALRPGPAFLSATDAVIDVLNEDTDNSALSDRVKVREKAVSLLLEEPAGTVYDLLQISRLLSKALGKQDEISGSLKYDAKLMTERLSQKMANVSFPSNKIYYECSKNILLSFESLIQKTTDEIAQLKRTNTTIGPEQENLLQQTNDYNRQLVTVFHDEVRHITEAREADSVQLKRDSMEILVEKRSISDLGSLNFNHSESSLVMPDVTYNGIIRDEDTQFQYYMATAVVQMVYLDKSPYTWSSGGEDASTPMVTISLLSEQLQQLDVFILPEPVNIFLQSNADATVYLGDIHLLGNASSMEIVEFQQKAYAHVIFRVEPMNNFTVEVFVVDALSQLDNLTDEQGAVFPKPELASSGDLLEDPRLLIIPQCGETCGDGSMYLGLRIFESNESFRDPNSSYHRVIVQKFTAACLYWNQEMDKWASDGCQMTRFTTLERVHCQCTHLTSFSASFLVVPNLVDPLDTALFYTFFDNPVIVVTVTLLWLLYAVLLIWAIKVDRRETAKLGAVDLADNDVEDGYLYLVGTITGWWAGAGTSARVFLSLQGSSAVSKRHALDDVTERRHFQKGMEDLFLLRTPATLGDLQTLTVWHDNDGPDPAWFLKQVTVLDVQRNKSWHFVYNNWLDVKRTKVTCVTLLAQDQTSLTRNWLYTMSLKSSQDLRESHLWFSIFTKPPTSAFSRAQRLTCGLVLLLTTMLTSLMFHGIPTDDPEDQLTSGPLTFSLSGLVIGIECGLIMFPVNLAIVQLFSRAAATPSQNQPAGASVEPSTSRVDVEQSTQQGTGGAQGQASDMATGKDEVCIMNMEQKDGSITRPDPTNPNRLVYVAWTVAIVTATVCSYFVMLYGLSYGYQRSLEWLVSFFTAFFQSVFLQQPLKIFTVAIIVTMILKKPLEENTFGPLAAGRVQAKKTKTSEPAEEQSSHHSRIRNPQAPGAIARLLSQQKLEAYSRELLKDILFHFTFAAVLVAVVYGHRHVETCFHSNWSAKSMLLHGAYDGTMALSEVSTVDGVWDYLKATVFHTSHRGYGNLAIDNVNYLVGNSRLRQKRVNEEACDFARDFIASAYPRLHCSRARGEEDTGTYRDAWIESEDVFVQSRPEYWAFQSASTLRTGSFTGRHGHYDGGGFVVELPKVSEEASNVTAVLQELHWLDERTKALFLEMSLYNANADMLTSVVILFEFTTTGGISPMAKVSTFKLFHYSSSTDVFVAVCEVVFVIYTLIFIYVEIKRLRTYGGKQHFSKFWNVVEILKILMSVCVIGLFFQRMVIVNRISAEYKESNDRKFVSFYEALFWDYVLMYDMAVLVLITTLQFLKLFQFNRRTAVLSETLFRAKVPVFCYMFVIIVVFVSFGNFGYLVFGKHIEDFRSVEKSVFSVLSIVLGEGDYYALQSCNSVLGSLFFFLVILVLLYCLLQVFVAAILYSFEQTRADLKQINCQVKMVKYMVSVVLDLIPSKN